ncbi:MAG: hypothetical protein ABH950_04715 [Candidatus Altiarchaeota archaeon]
MKVTGVDLAGSPKNPTGFCVLSIDKNEKIVRCKILYSDEDLISEIKKEAPKLTAVDAPLTFEGKNRSCDENLHRYGALPVTLRGMEVLARRGKAFGEQLTSEKIKAIEVNTKVSAKILGLASKKDFEAQKKLLSVNLSGDITERYLSRDELDAVYAAITAYLHLEGQTSEVGETDGKVIIPKI